VRSERPGRRSKPQPVPTAELSSEAYDEIAAVLVGEAHRLATADPAWLKRIDRKELASWIAVSLAEQREEEAVGSGRLDGERNREAS
jgi:hypothetical protein